MTAKTTTPLSVPLGRVFSVLHLFDNRTGSTAATVVVVR